ncbi:unnamed protein product, partial [Polarella glacialis]
SDIMKTQSFVPRGEVHGPTSMTRDSRKKELTKISQENGSILRRIQQVQPVYNRVDWENDYAKSYENFKNCCEYPPVLARPKKGPQRASSLTRVGDAGDNGRKKLNNTFSGSASASHLAPGEDGHQPAADLRYVLKEGKQISGEFFLVEMATDGRSLAITAYEGDKKRETLELLVSEKNHRQLYRDHNGDYNAIAAKLRVAGAKLVLDHEGLIPDVPMNRTM